MEKFAPLFVFYSCGCMLAIFILVIEIVFVPLLFYPQWKIIRLLVTFIYDRDKDKLDEALDKFDSEVGVMEPFLESAIQVS